MLERTDKTVFFFTIECAVCRNVAKVSHVVIEDQKGSLVCSLCGKTVKVPSFEILVKASKDLNAYLGDNLNAKYIKILLNPEFHVDDAVPLAGH